MSVVNRPAADPRRFPFPPAIPIVALLVSWGVGRKWPIDVNWPVWSRWVGWALVIASVVLAVSAVRTFRRHHAAINPLGQVTTVVASGPFRFTRNPMYVGVFFLVLSRAVYFWSVRIVVYLLLVAICVNLFILFYEEPHLRKVFGEQYLDYCRRVPRWIPRMRAAR
jgi:protein-S-isoprenylcysteine O-methyltransferase Ste14